MDHRSGFVLGQLVTALPMGGAENLSIQIANAHAARGLESHLIVLLGPGPLSPRIAPDVQVHYLGYRRESIRNPLKFLFSVIRGYRLISRVIRYHRIQVLQSHLPDANLWGLAIALGGKCSVVATIHNNRFLGEERRNPLARSLKHFIYRRIFLHCRAVVACSEEVRLSILKGLGISGRQAERVFTVTNGVLSPPPLAPEEISAIRERWGVGSGGTLLLAAGRFTAAKNFACLIDAIAVLGRLGIHPQLVIGGDGPLRPELEKQVGDLGLRDQVLLPGNLPELQSIMAAADCLVIPSRWEGLPLVLLEGMVRELPVVGTKIKGIDDIIEHGRNGYLVDVDDAADLAEGIRVILGDPAAARLMGNNNRRLVEEKFSFQRVYEELAVIFDRVLRP